ncbi:MAG: FHA domain-containing protein [Armatimonadota bacterium]|nr:MAG: FHA domain-containing protein [Armatimonadota bacterium]
MYCQECGKESQPGEVICSSCGGALTDAELDLPEVAPFATSEPAQTEESGAARGAEAEATPRMPVAPPLPETDAAAGAAQGPRVDVTVGDLTGSYPLKPGVTTIGRTDPTTDSHPDVDLSMDAAVSRQHAEIRHTADGYRIYDVGSTNGTVVNGRQVPRHQEVPLADGDEIHVGESCRLTVRL